MTNNNPETLKYNLNDTVEWLNEETETIHRGTVVNITFEGLDILEGNRKVFVPYIQIIPPGL